MKNLHIVATAILACQVFAGILPPVEKVLTLQPEAEYTDNELLDY